MNCHIVLFGGGVFAMRILAVIEKYFCVEAVCDNCPDLWGNLFNGKYPIISVETLKEKYSNCNVLITLNDSKNYETVSEQLKKLGIAYRHVNDELYDRCVKNNDFFCIDECNKNEIEKIKSDKRNIFLLTAPSHSNLGDQAQTYCTEMLLKEKNIGSNIFIYDEERIIKNYYELLYIIKQNLKKDDIILLHSGYRLTNLYMQSVYIVEMMAQLFKDRKMIFLPQTVHFTDEMIQTRLSKEINSKVKIMCRDTVSYKKASEIFARSKIILYPDIVTSLIGRYKFDHPRNGILFCMRKADDGESLISDREKENLITALKNVTEVSDTDTTIAIDWKEIAANRKYYIEKEIEKFSRFQLVITNRFHGTILALAANTPVIVLPTKDHKITAGLKWFEEAEYNGIYFCRKEDVIPKATDIIHDHEKLSYSDYFYKTYYKDFNLEDI